MTESPQNERHVYATPAGVTAAGESALDGESPRVPEAAARRLARVVPDERLRRIVEQYLLGELSPPVAVMQLAIATESADRVREAVDAITAEVDRDARATDGVLHDRVDALTRLVVEQGPGVARIAAMLASGVDTARMMPTVDEGLAHVERLFDWGVTQNEEASVALYSLGSPEILAAATAEVVGWLDDRGLLGADRDVLQIGCGIGRMEAAVSPLVREAWGVDVSGAMVEAARRRCEGLANVHVEKTDGRDLSRFPDDRFDLVYAVDTFPYLVQAGDALVERHVAEARRVLRPGGALAVFNYSYRDDLHADRRDVRRLAALYGFDVAVDGEREFELWDGLTWLLRLVREGETG